jgi:hypothetical protein
MELLALVPDPRKRRGIRAFGRCGDRGCGGVGRVKVGAGDRRVGGRGPHVVLGALGSRRSPRTGGSPPRTATPSAAACPPSSHSVTWPTRPTSGGEQELQPCPQGTGPQPHRAEVLQVQPAKPPSSTPARVAPANGVDEHVRESPEESVLQCQPGAKTADPGSRQRTCCKGRMGHASVASTAQKCEKKFLEGLTCRPRRSLQRRQWQ